MWNAQERRRSGIHGLGAFVWFMLVERLRAFAAPLRSVWRAPGGALLGQRLAAITSGLPGASSPRRAHPQGGVPDDIPDGLDVDAPGARAGSQFWDGARRQWMRLWAWARAARASAAGVVVAQATGVWVATRVAYALFTYFVVMFRYSGTVHDTSIAYTSHSLSDIFRTWQQWDAVWYMKIAAHGYSGWQSTAFFPLYPLLIRLASFIVGPHWLLAALIVSNLATWTGFIALSMLAAQEFGDINLAWRAMLVAAAYPLAFFLTAPYTEGLFLTFAGFALYFARRGAWRRAGVMTFLATLTHVTGVILIPALAWEFARQHGWLALYEGRVRQAWGGVSAAFRRRSLGDPARVPGDNRVGDATPLDAASAAPRMPADVALSLEEAPRDGAPAPRSSSARYRNLRARALILVDLVFIVGAAPFAIVLYAAYLWTLYQHPLVFYHAQGIFWQRQSMPIWQAIPFGVEQFLKAPLFSYWQARTWVDLAPIVLFGLLTLLTIRRMPFAFTLYLLGLLYLSISSPVYRINQPDVFVSAGRFFVVAIPLFLLLGKWIERRRWLETLIISGGFMLQATLAIFFLSGGWLI